MIISCTTNAGRLAFLKGELNSSLTYKLALYTKEANLGKKTAKYSSSGEVTGQGYEVKTLATPTYGIDEDTDLAYLEFSEPLVWKGSTISADGCMIFTDTLAVYTGAFGSTVSSTNDSFTLTLPRINLK